jgi:hypothetical protein
VPGADRFAVAAREGEPAKVVWVDERDLLVFCAARGGLLGVDCAAVGDDLDPGVGQNLERVPRQSLMDGDDQAGLFDDFASQALLMRSPR